MFIEKLDKLYKIGITRTLDSKMNSVRGMVFILGAEYDIPNKLNHLYIMQAEA